MIIIGVSRTVLLNKVKELSPLVAGTSFEERCFVSLNMTGFIKAKNP
ncbi:MAG: hypothetical protein ABI723_04450 [Bacteroidia bacterium]